MSPSVPFAILLSLGGLCAAPMAAAQSSSVVAGRGRVSASPGWHLAGNGPLIKNAEAQGITLAPSSGGPIGVLGFAYGATEQIEVAIELYAASDRLSSPGIESFSSVSYGGMAGIRYIHTFKLGTIAFQPHATGMLGPSLILLSGANTTSLETVTTGYLLGVGLTALLGESWGLTLEYRHLFARGAAPIEIGGTVNGGGHQALLGFAWFMGGPPPDQHAF